MTSWNTTFTLLYEALETTPAVVPDVTSRYPGSMLFMQFAPVALYVDRAVTPIWYIIGSVGNALSAFVWSGKGMKSYNSSAVYLAALSVTDLFFLILHVFMELLYAWDVNTLGCPVWCECYFVIYQTLQYLSPVLVLAFTCERWIAVCRPFERERYCTRRRAIFVICIIALLCTSLGSMQAYLWTYTEGECVPRKGTYEAGQRSLFYIWAWITEMLVFLVVPLTILLFNILVILEIRKMSEMAGNRMLPASSNSVQTNSPRSKEAATTVMLLCVSFYVICTTLPATLVYALSGAFDMGAQQLTDQEVRTDPVWRSFFSYFTCRKIVEEIGLSHYACNVFLYICTGPQFRAAVKALVTGRMDEGYASPRSMSINATGRITLRSDNNYSACGKLCATGVDQENDLEL